MPPKPKAKPKAPPRRGAAATVETPAPTTAPSATPVPPVPQSQPSTSRPREETLFIQDNSESEEETAPFIVDNDIELNDANGPNIESDGQVSEVEGEQQEEESDEDDDEDPVIQSYDIIINDKLQDMLYLFQYPVRGRDQPYTTAEGLAPLDARWKVNSGLVELDIPVNTNKNYDQDKGVHWGQVMHRAKMERGMLNMSRTAGSKGVGVGPSKRRRGAPADDEESDDDSTSTPGFGYQMDFEEAKRKERILNRQTLGAKIQPDDMNYFVGVWREDKLHLTKLQDTLQLRPQFPHVDLANEQDKAGAKAIREANNPTPARPQEARAVNLTVKGGDAKGEGRSVFGDQLTKDLRKEEDEQWRELTWVDQDLDESWEMYENLFKQEPRHLDSVFTKEEYLKWCSAPRLEPVNPLKGSARKIPMKKEKQ